MERRGIMKKMLGLLLLSACATNLPGPSAGDPTWNVGALSFQKQSNAQWCGAETARILLEHKGKKLSQTDIISKVTGVDCASSSSTKCGQAIYPQDALKLYGYSPVVDTTPTLSEVVALIKSGKPVGISHYWRDASGSPDRGAHVVTAVAAYEHAGKPYIQVWDSLAGKLTIMDESFVVGNLAWIFTVHLR